MLVDAAGYLGVLSEANSAKLERAAIRWHGPLETEAAVMRLTDSQRALAADRRACSGERDALNILRAVLRRAMPTLLPQVS